MLGCGLYFNTTGEFLFSSSWYDLLIFEFSNSQIFDFLEFFRIRILSRCSFIFFEFRIFFSTSFYGVYEGLILLFYLFFIKIYKNALFSEQNPIAVNWKIIWLLRLVRPLGAHVCASSKPKLGTRNLAWKEIFSSRGELFPKLNQQLGWRWFAMSSSLGGRGGFIFDANTRWWYISDWWNISNLYEISPI